MMTPHRMASLACLLASVEAAACAPSGKLEVYIDTDMGLVNNIDTISLIVSVSGSVKYRNAFSVSGTDDRNIKLTIPGSIVFDAPEPDPLAPVTVEVTAWNGGENGIARGYNKRVVTLPEHASLTTFVPLEFLCTRMVKKKVESNFKVTGTSTCPDGEPDDESGERVENVCASARCIPVQKLSVPSEFDPAKGALECFDVQDCFDSASVPAEAVEIPKEGQPCTFELKKDGLLRRALASKTLREVNVAFQMKESAKHLGICDREGNNCLVVPTIPDEILDRIPDSVSEGTVTLPEDFCEELRKHEDDVENILLAHVTPECPHRTPERPLCRPPLY
ncbi:hypothetical protein WME76_29275 [Sorangium sp. So ce119]|uniref:hypothetical protein n=1 Tax=Sorangium sp. So ce119 TaxID=3133279 RepID=UPI003F5EFC02